MLRKQTRVATVLHLFIDGSTRSGWPMSPHFQVKSLAATEAGRKLDTQLFKGMRYKHSKLGYNEITHCPVTANCNKKTDMDNKNEYCKYIEESIIPLYPDAVDEPCRRVLLLFLSIVVLAGYKLR